MNKRKDHIIKIRLAQKEEASAISGLLYQSFVEYKPFYTEKGFSATTLSINEVENRIRENIVWVALYINVIAGTITLMPRGDGILIKSVAVAPLARRKGLGKELMKHGERVASEKGSKYLELTTTPFLYEAIQLYERFGFEQDGVEDLYGTTLIRMKKNLETMSDSLITQKYSGQS